MENPSAVKISSNGTEGFSKLLLWKWTLGKCIGTKFEKSLKIKIAIRFAYSWKIQDSLRSKPYVYLKGTFNPYWPVWCHFWSKCFTHEIHFVLTLAKYESPKHPTINKTKSLIVRAPLRVIFLRIFWHYGWIPKLEFHCVAIVVIKQFQKCILLQ